MEHRSIPNLRRAKPAAQHFDIGVSTLWLWAKSRPGFPKPIRASAGVTLFDVLAIEQYLRAQSGVA